MSLLTNLKRAERIHECIEQKCTGEPEEFARKMGISRSTLYQIIRELKSLGAPIVYCKYRQSFRYRYPVYWNFSFTEQDAFVFLDPEEDHTYSPDSTR